MRRIGLLLMVTGLVVIGAVAYADRPPRDGGGRRPPPPPPGEGREGRRHNDTAAEDNNFVTLRVSDTSADAFTNPLPIFDDETLEAFEEGDALFEEAFVTATGADLANDGLGPFFNAVSCEACHANDGRGRPPGTNGETATGFLIRTALSEHDPTTRHTLNDPRYGGQFQDLAIDGVLPEGEIVITYEEIDGTFADGTPYTLRQPVYEIVNLNYGALDPQTTLSPRVANQMIGLGLLEAVPAEQILALADPDDADGDGVSGRPNYVYDFVNDDVALGRFGWKASHPSLLQQSAGAYNEDMGVTSWVFPVAGCTDSQHCDAFLDGGQPEVSAEHLDLVVLYASGLAVPERRHVDDAQVLAGEAIFAEAQCNSCHVAELVTDDSSTLGAVGGYTIQPYTDLLLHDMGEGLADNQTDYMASGREWRTAPLWGIGLTETVNGNAFYLHDGRAQSLMEAILWHGGEAQASRDYVLGLSADERAALVAFLRSL